MQQSIWQHYASEQLLPTLSTDKSCDVCIIGGGLSGIYTALKLVQQGLHVILLERNEQVALGTTGLSTGKITAQHGLIYSKLNATQGKLYYEAQQSAVQHLLETLPNDLFSHVHSYLYASTVQGKKTLTEEFEAYKQLGIAAELTNDVELNIPIQLACRLNNEAQVNPVSLTQYFANEALRLGAEIYGNIQVTHIDPQKKYVVTSNGLRIQCQHIVLCTHYPITSFQQLLLLKLSVSRSYLLAAPTEQCWEGQYISTDNSTRTARTATIDKQHFIIYGGGSELAGTNASTNNHYELLQQEVKEQFAISSITNKWSAQDVITGDLLPYVGPLTENLYIATGFRKWGLSNSIVAGEILAASINQQQHEAQALFHPHRKSFGKSLLRIMAQTGFIAAQLISGYSTRVHAPKCTHLGCKTRWNEADQTWDCPCHGSRYNALGHVIEGPAVYPLNIKTDTPKYRNDA